MIQCQHCGNEWDSGAMFCPECGKIGRPITTENEVQYTYQSLKKELSGLIDEK